MPTRPRERRGDHAGVPGGPQAQPRQRRDAKSSRHQCLNRKVVVGGEGDPRRESSRLALPDQVGAAALATGDPPAAGVRRETCDRHSVAGSGGARKGAARNGAARKGAARNGGARNGGAENGAARRRAGCAASRRRGDQVYRLVQQQHAAGALVGGLRRRVAGVFLVVLEHDRDVHVPRSQHAQGLWRLGLRQHELQAARLGSEPGRGRRDQRAKRGGERGKSHPSAPQPDVGSQLSLGRIQPADDFLGSLGQQLARFREPDAAPDALQELGTGFRLKPGDVMADGRLGVVESAGCGGNRAMTRNRDQNPESGHIQHCSTIDRLDLSDPSARWGIGSAERCSCGRPGLSSAMCLVGADSAASLAAA